MSERHTFAFWLAQCAFCVLVAGCKLGANPVLDFKGLRLGSTEAEIRSKFPNAKCDDKVHPLIQMKVRECVDREGTIAEVRAEVHFLMRDTRVREIWVFFPRARFDVVVESLNEKFGKPSFDGKYSGPREIVWEWKQVDDTVQVFEVPRDARSDDKHRSLVKFVSHRNDDDVERVKQRSKDL